MDRRTRYRRFFTSISTQDVDIDFDIGWQGGSFWIMSYPISTFFDVDIEEKRRYRPFLTLISKKNVDNNVKKGRYRVRRYQRFCDNDIERKRRYRDNRLPKMLQTMIWMMIAQWMKMSASITRINNLYISQLQLECMGPMAQFLSDMPDFLEGIEESLQRALDALPIPTPGPPDGISILEAIQVSRVNSTCPL